MKRVTQKDVARAAGVSQATVSLVLSGGTPSIPAETWGRITDAAKELGYVPNRFAQALKTRRTMTLACIVPDITNPFYPSLVRGIQNVTDRASYDVITVNTDGTEERERHFLDWARQGRVDGVIGVFFALKARDFAPLIEAGVPVVRIESTRKRGGALAIDDIFVDNRAAALAATRHLIDAGRRRVAMIAGKGGPQSARVDGYRAALAAVGLVPQVVVDEAFNEVGGARATQALLTQALLNQAERPSAILAANDLMAIGAMQTLSAHGIAIPGDVAVMGFDDIPASRLVTPALSTVAQFQGRLGESAAQMLMARLSGERKGPGGARELPFELVVRASTSVA